MNVPLENKTILASDAPLSTPWEKRLSFQETYEYSQRHIQTIGVGFMQVMRIIEPDYEKRASTMCRYISDFQYEMYQSAQFQHYFRSRHNIPEDEHGAYLAGLVGDQGDESLLMSGRVIEFTPDRVEKELDTCPWDIVGSEVCRATVAGFSRCFDALARDGDDLMNVEMVEARGWGDQHCRIVAENRKKYNRRQKEVWQLVGPSLSDVTCTPREEMFTQPMQLRAADRKYRNPYGAEWSREELFASAAVMPGASMYIIPAIRALEPDAGKVAHITRCVFEAAGKWAFAEFAAVKGMRNWLGVPDDVNDGRVLGALAGVQLGACLIPFAITEFTPERTVIDIQKDAFLRDNHGGYPEFEHAFGALWKGMALTLVNAEWTADFAGDVPEDRFRLVIERRTDKFR